MFRGIIDIGSAVSWQFSFDVGVGMGGVVDIVWDGLVVIYFVYPFFLRVSLHSNGFSSNSDKWEAIQLYMFCLDYRGYF